MIQWSQEYFTGLTYNEHVANNHWFNMMLKMLKDDGKLYVPMPVSYTHLPLPTNREV